MTKPPERMRLARDAGTSMVRASAAGVLRARRISVATWNISLAYFVRLRLGIWSFAAPGFIERAASRRASMPATRTMQAAVNQKEAA